MINPTKLEPFVTNAKFLIRQFVVARVSQKQTSSLAYDHSVANEDEELV